MTKVDDGAWFLPKRFGLGSGIPIAWQGWALLAAHIALVAVGAPWADRAPVTFAVWAMAITLAAMPIYAARTRGGWHWRWGRD